MIGFVTKEMEKGKKNSILNFFIFCGTPQIFLWHHKKTNIFFWYQKQTNGPKKAVIFFFLPTFVVNEVK